jgi:hypothetical protein
MGRATLTALAVERAHRSGEPVLLSDGDGLYLRKQTRDGARGRCAIASPAASIGSRSVITPT